MVCLSQTGRQQGAAAWYKAYGGRTNFNLNANVYAIQTDWTLLQFLLVLFFYPCCVIHQGEYMLIMGYQMSISAPVFFQFENQFVLSHKRDVNCEMFCDEGRGCDEDFEHDSSILTMMGKY